MRKKFLCLMLALTMAVSVTACGKGKDVPSSQTGETTTEEKIEIVYENEYIKLANYKGLECNSNPVEVVEADITGNIESVVNQYYATINNNATTTDATSTDAIYYDYKNITDDMIKEATSGEYKTVSDYYNHVKEELTTQKESEQNTTLNTELFNKVCSNSELVQSDEEIKSNELYKKYYDYSDDYYKEYADYMGYEWKDFLENYIMAEDEAAYEEIISEEAKKNMKSQYVIEAIAENEGITVDDSEIDSQIQSYIDTGYYETEEDVLTYISRDDIKLNVMYYKVLDVIRNNAVDKSSSTVNAVDEDAATDAKTDTTEE